MLVRFFLLLILIGFLQTPCLSQTGGPPKKEQSIKSKRKQRKEDKRKWKEERRNKRAEEKKIRDHHKRIQTKEVRKRMKRNKGKAIRNNTHQREPFFQRLFNRKNKGKRTKQAKEKTQKVQ